MEVKFIPTEQLKEKPDENALGFGNYFTDYMFTMDWTKEKGWHNAVIEPYGSIQLDPASMVLHYAQETFEGLKAYKTKEGKVLLFRPDMNAKDLQILIVVFVWKYCRKKCLWMQLLLWFPVKKSGFQR